MIFINENKIDFYFLLYEDDKKSRRIL